MIYVGADQKCASSRCRSVRYMYCAALVISRKLFIDKRYLYSMIVLEFSEIQVVILRYKRSILNSAAGRLLLLYCINMYNSILYCCLLNYEGLTLRSGDCNNSLVSHSLVYETLYIKCTSSPLFPLRVMLQRIPARYLLFFLGSFDDALVGYVF